MNTSKTTLNNRIGPAMAQDKKLLSIYFTAGFPALEDTVPVLEALQDAGVDMVEIGLPFSDPLADGPTIQESSTDALRNGMNTRKLFEQLRGIREKVNIPLILMGYFNPVLQYGVEAFCRDCAAVGIDGLILPDLPLEAYEREYKELFEAHGLSMIFLITPQTSEQRIRQLDEASGGFLYMVSSASTTGSQKGFDQDALAYFQRIENMGLKNPAITGFGISNAETFAQATSHAKGAIIGSAFIRHLREHGPSGTSDFIKRIR